MKIEEITKLLPRGEISRNVVILTAGTAFGQGITVVVAPILTRLYDPSDFGVSALFTSVVSFFLVAATLRYDWAIPNPDKDADAINLLMICFLVTTCVAALSLPLMLFFFAQFSKFSNLSLIRPYLWLVPFYIVGGGAYQNLNAWAIRKKSFTPIAKTRLSQSVTGSVVNIALGLFRFGPLGLLFGGLASHTAGIGTLGRLLWNNDRTLINGIRKENVVSWFKHYLKFAVLSTGQAIVNTASLQITTILLMTYFEASVAGWYYLAQRIISIPTGLIGQAAGQTFWAEAAQLIRKDPKELKRLFLKFSRKLGALSLVIALLGIASPLLFGFVFGSEKWNMAGRYALYLTPMVMAQFIVGTLTHLGVHELQNWHLTWDTCRVALILLCFWTAHKLEWTVSTTLLAYSLMMSGTYWVLYVLNIRAIEIKIRAFYG